MCSPGRKQPLHNTTLAFTGKVDIRIALDIMGGWNSCRTHSPLVANFVDFGRNIQAAMEEARFAKEDSGGCDVQIPETA